MMEIKKALPSYTALSSIIKTSSKRLDSLWWKEIRVAPKKYKRMRMIRTVDLIRDNMSSIVFVKLLECFQSENSSEI